MCTRDDVKEIVKLELIPFGKKLTAIQTNGQTTLKAVQKINGSIAEHAKRINVLEEHGRHRETECPYREDIGSLMQDRLTEQTLKTYMEQQKAEAEKVAKDLAAQKAIDDNKRQKRIELFLIGATVIISLVAYLS